MMVLVSARWRWPPGIRACPGSGWALAAGVKWAPLALLPLSLLARAATSAGGVAVGFLVAASAIATAAFLAFGTGWLTTQSSRSRNATPPGRSRPARPAGLPGWLALVPLAIAVPWLVRSARAGRGRLGLTSGLLLVGTPWLLPWYAVWAVALAAVEEDAAAWVLTLALCAYLLPDRVPI